MTMRTLSCVTSRAAAGVTMIRRRQSSSFAPILRLVEEGKLSADKAEKLIIQEASASRLSAPPDGSLESFANLDHNRSSRTGFPEAIYASGKTAEQVATILDDMARHVNASIIESSDQLANHAILATRVDSALWEELSNLQLSNGTVTYHEMARIVSMKASGLISLQERREQNVGEDADVPTKVVVACAGTTDLPVAEEAAITLEEAGCEVDRVYDVGVAGLHRIIGALPRLRDPSVGCVIVCAGMDGALPSVLGGLVSVPVVAVPTSIGYGASFGGVSALLTMLNSCAPGVCAVNIDNGFGAAALAFKMVRSRSSLS